MRLLELDDVKGCAARASNELGLGRRGILEMHAARTAPFFAIGGEVGLGDDRLEPMRAKLILTKGACDHCDPRAPTYLEHFAAELNEDNMTALYVPERFAHGYQTLRDNTDMSYQVGEFYTPNAEGGLRYADTRLGLRWPLPVSVISAKDQAFRSLREIEG